MSDVISGLESDLEQVKSLMRSSSTAHASAAKALVRLRTNRDGFVRLVENAKSAVSILEKNNVGHEENSSDLLSPLLLLLSHKDVPASGVCASLSGVQRLVQANLLTPADGENICNCLENLTNRRENSIDFKTLQTCGVLVRSSTSESVEVCRRVVSLTTSIADEDRTKDLGVRKAAIGEMIQISTAIFERTTKNLSSKEYTESAKRLFEELCSVPERNDSSSSARAGMGLLSRGSAIFSKISTVQPITAKSALSSNTGEIWIEPNRICNKDALEILDSILTDHHVAFENNPGLSNLIQEKCGPTVLNLLKGKYRESSNSGGYGWPLLVRLMRVTKHMIILKHLSGENIALNAFQELISMLETENSDLIVTPQWHYVLTLETVLAIFQSNGFLGFLFTKSLSHTQRCVEALSRLVQTWSSDWNEIDHVAKEAELIRGESSARRNKSRGLELLSDAEPPAHFAEPTVVLVSAECLVAALADGGLKDTPTVRVGGLLRRSNSSSSDLEQNISLNLRKTVLEVTWKPCLAAFSHLLGGCQEEGMVQYLLRAYLSLTTSCGSAHLVDARDAFITSMCRFALPTNFPAYSTALTSFQTPTDVTLSQSFRSSSSNKDLQQLQQQSLQQQQQQSDRLLTHKHLQVLKTLFNVAHGLGSILGTSWHIVLETFEQLDLVLQVQRYQQNLANRNTDAESDGGGGANTSVLEEINEEEIEEETKMIESMLKNLFDSSKFLEEEAVVHLVIALSQMIFTGLAHASTFNTQNSMPSPGKALIKPTQSTDSSAPRRIIENLTQTLKTALSNQGGSSQSLPTSSTHVVGEEFRFPPFALDKLVETTELNIDRIGAIWEVIGSTLLTVGSCENDARYRTFAVKSMEKLVTKVISSQDNPTLRRDVVRKFTELARSPQLDTKDASLQALYRFVSSTGHRLEGLWNLIVAELLIISTSSQTNKTTIGYAFKVVQLIMDDYRPSLDVGCLPSLALCLRAFGEQQNDVNMALTSVHHLWLLCEKGDESLEFPNPGGPPTKESLQVANALWLHVFDQLRLLSLDPRMEVRNSALRSLCTNVVATGDRLTVNSWKVISVDIMLPLIDAVDSKAFQANSKTHVLGERLGSHTEQRMTVHHSQDTEEKQWRETRVTALQGTCKIVSSIMQKIENYKELEWFLGLWNRLFGVTERVLISHSPAKDVVTAAVSVVEELGLLVCGARSKTKYAVPGMRVVNGALVRSPPPVVDGSTSPEPSPAQKKSKNVLNSTHIWLWPSLLKIFQKLSHIEPPPFDTDTAALLVNFFSELYETKECDAPRTEESLKIILTCCSVWTKSFGKVKNSSKFISPLERNVLKTYSKLPPLPDDDIWVTIVFPELEKSLQQETESKGKIATVREEEEVVEGDKKIEENEFQSKVKLVYSDLFSQAPDSVKAGSLRQQLNANSAIVSSQVVHLGLASLPDSGMLLDESEAVWLKVLEKSDKTSNEVLMKEGVPLLRHGKVPIGVRDQLLMRLEQQTMSSSTSFEMKVQMIGNFFDGISSGGELGKMLIKITLNCCTDALTYYDHPLFEGFLRTLIDLEIDPKIVSKNMFSKIPFEAATQREFRKPHLLQLLEQLKIAASQSLHVNVRLTAVSAIAEIAMEGWKMY